MAEEVRSQFNTIPGLMKGTAKLDYATCVKISTDASIKEMMPLGALVMLTPLIVGTLFGVETLSGVLAGALVSGVQIAISASNTGGAWDNAKKYIEAGNSEHARSLGPKGLDCHQAAVIGDTIGDPLKDTSGPPLNILIKLMAVESLCLPRSLPRTEEWCFIIWISKVGAYHWYGRYDTASVGAAPMPGMEKPKKARTNSLAT